MLWDKEKEALWTDRVRVTRRTSRSGPRAFQRPNLTDKCCGTSPEKYGHQLDAHARWEEQSYNDVKRYMEKLDQIVNVKPTRYDRKEYNPEQESGTKK